MLSEKYLESFLSMQNRLPNIPIASAIGPSLITGMIGR